MEVVLLDKPDGEVIARGAYYGGPDYEFFVAADGKVYFRVVGDRELVWAGPDAESFRRITKAWNRYQDEVRRISGEAAQLKRVERLRQELAELGALPKDMPPNPEPLWSMLLFEAENGLG